MIMGEAKQRGSFEKRLEQLILADEIIEKAFPEKETREQVIAWNGGKMKKRMIAYKIIQEQQREPVLVINP